MSLTSGQKTLLKAYIIAQPDLLAKASGAGTDYVGLCDLLNADANPATKAWKTSVPPEIVDEASNWTTFDSLTAGKRDSYRFFLDRNRDFTRNKVRSWITDVWGNATAGSAAEALLNAGIENASRAQAAIGGNLKTTGTVAAIDRAFIGLITVTDIHEMAPFV